MLEIYYKQYKKCYHCLMEIMHFVLVIIKIMWL